MANCERRRPGAQRKPCDARESASAWRGACATLVAADLRQRVDRRSGSRGAFEDQLASEAQLRCLLARRQLDARESAAPAARARIHGARCVATANPKALRNSSRVPVIAFTGARERIAFCVRRAGWIRRLLRDGAPRDARRTLVERSRFAVAARRQAYGGTATRLYAMSDRLAWSWCRDDARVVVRILQLAAWTGTSGIVGSVLRNCRAFRDRHGHEVACREASASHGLVVPESVVFTVVSVPSSLRVGAMFLVECLGLF